MFSLCGDLWLGYFSRGRKSRDENNIDILELEKQMTTVTINVTIVICFLTFPIIFQGFHTYSETLSIDKFIYIEILDIVPA